MVDISPLVCTLIDTVKGDVASHDGFKKIQPVPI